MNYEFVIVGDSPKFDNCLIYCCGKDEAHAKRVLDRVLSAPTDNDKRITKDYVNIRIEKVPDEHCWWNRNCE